MSEPATPGSEPLSVEAAIASLVEPEAHQDETPTPEAPEEAAEVEETPSEAATTAEDTQGEAEQPGDEGEEQAETVEPEIPEVDPPAWWTAEQKARFKELPPDLQAVVREQETIRERVVSEAKAKAAEEAKAAQKEMEGVRTLAQQLSTFLPEALKTFQSRWGDQEPDWAQLAEQYGDGEAFKLKAQYDREQKQLVQVAQAEQAARQEAHKAFLKTEWEALTRIAPDLAPDISNPTQGQEKRQAVVKYLVEYGIPQENIAQISAREMSLARKAMLYDQLQAAAATKPKPKPAAPAPKATVRPSAGQPQTSSSRSTQAVANRFAQTKSVDDAVALLLARQGIQQ